MAEEESKSKDSTLKKEKHLKDYLEDNSDEQIRKAEDYLKKINSQLTNRFSRIDKIKRSHEKFEKEIDKLQSGTISQSRESYVEMVNGVFDIPDAIKVNTELSELIEKYADEKLDLMKKLFINEKKQTKEINNKLKESMSRIAISEQKLIRQRDDLEIELREKNKRLVQVERLSAIGELSARLAHDLRNPLTVIKGVVEISKTKSNSQKNSFSERQIDMMERAISRMANQINDVLEFVKIQSLRTSRNSLLDTLGMSLAKIQKSNGVKLIIPKNGIECVYDADKIEVVFDNLITNALQSINDNGCITIRMIDLENDVIIEIEDTGTGVPNDIMPKIFEPLFTTKKKGTGLGLASCKSIIEQHGGSISVKNNPSVFTIKIPKMLEISTI